MKQSLLFIALFLLLSKVVSGQNSDKKWSIEIGATSSILMNKVHYKNSLIDTITYNNWSKIRPMPTFRLTRKFQFFKQNAVFVKPFIGASVIGTETNQAQERVDLTTPVILPIVHESEMIYYYMPTAEVGGLFGFQIGNFDVELGLKGQYHFTLWTNHFYMKGEIISENPPVLTMERVDYKLENIFTRFSANAGLRIAYNFNRFSIAAESWYGITNLSVFEFEGIELYQNELNFRLLFGYRF